MGMNKQKGNMFDWVTHTHTHIGGRCPHRCSYCSVQALQKRFPNLPYSGDLFLKEREFGFDYGEGNTIFVENCNDMFADAVPSDWIARILAHCRAYPLNTYVFQTKDPSGYLKFRAELPEKALIGTTIETNREYNTGSAPLRRWRYGCIERARVELKVPVFVTIEPIMDFDLEELIEWLVDISPTFVNIGADSKGHGLPEPSIEKVSELVKRLQREGIEVRKKRNLDRLGGKA